MLRLAELAVDLQALKVLLRDDVDHACNRIRTIHRDRTGLHDVDVIDHVERDRIHVEERVGEVHRLAVIRHPLPVHQHQRVFLAQTAQCNAAAALRGAVHRRLAPAAPRVGGCAAQEVGHGRITALLDFLGRDGLDFRIANLVRCADQRAGHFKFLELLNPFARRRRGAAVRGRRGSSACRRRAFRRCARRCAGGGRLALCKRRYGDCGRQCQFSPDYSSNGQRQCPLFHFSPSRSSVRPQQYVMRGLVNLSTRYTAILRRAPLKQHQITQCRTTNLLQSKRAALFQFLSSLPPREWIPPLAGLFFPNRGYRLK